jgi:hypothetical protein
MVCPTGKLGKFSALNITNRIPSPSEEEVQNLASWAAGNLIPLTPRGEASSGYGGVLLVEQGIVVDFYRLKSILSNDKEKLTATVQPGVVWERLDHELKKKRGKEDDLPALRDDGRGRPERGEHLGRLPGRTTRRGSQRIWRRSMAPGRRRRPPISGCTASYLEPDIGMASVRLLDTAGVDFTYVGNRENCSFVFIYSTYLSSNSNVLTTLIFFHGVLVGL